jgi:hypothetical protein
MDFMTSDRAFIEDHRPNLCTWPIVTVWIGFPGRFPLRFAGNVENFNFSKFLPCELFYINSTSIALVEQFLFSEKLK